jgi:hypothetical protein
MTVLDDIKELGRETSASNRKLVRALTKEELADRMAERIRAHRDTLLDASGGAYALYKIADFSARRIPVEMAVELWKETRHQFRAMRKQWESVEKFDEPEIDGIIEHLCKVLRDLAEKADQEYRAYTETAHLLDSPANAKRLAEALDEANSGRAKEMTLDELRSHSSGR